MKFFFIAVVCIFMFSCDKLIEIPSNNAFLLYEDVKSKEELLESYVFSIYDDLYYVFNNQAFSNPNTNISVVVGAFSDEFFQNVAISDATLRHAYYNSYYNNDPYIPNFFTSYYKIIIRCNNLLDRFLVGENNDVILRSEIRAIRSIIYYYLIQLYEEIPLIESSDIDINLFKKRTNKNDVYKFCISELEQIKDIVGDEKKKLSSHSGEYFFTERINRNVVFYYLSSFYLLNGDYLNSIKYSLELVNDFNFNQSYDKKFELTSSENIWVLMPSVTNGLILFNNANASLLNYKLWPSADPFNSVSRPFSLSDSLISLMSNNDKRRINFIDSVMYNSKWRYLPYKYKVVGNFTLNSIKEQFVIIRLPMIYFNLIEAYLQSGQNEKASYYYNAINEVNYTNYSTVYNISLSDVVLERYKELFCEMGDRWFTLKRLNLLDSVMNIYTPIKSQGLEKWNSASMSYLPIPLKEILDNPNL